MAGRKQIPKTIDVFISYSRRDQAVADRVHQRLVERRLSCFYDTRSISVGDEWRSRLYRAIQSAKTVILIISPSSLESKEVLRETNKALIYGAILCPIVIGSVDPDADLCMLVNEYHWLESDEPPSDEELDLLVDRVAAIVGVDQKAPTVKLTAPTDEAHWRPGETVRIAWDAQPAPGTSIQQISMELLADGATVYSFPGKNAPWAGTVRECEWTIPANLPPGRYPLRLIAISNLGHVGWAESVSPISISPAEVSAAISEATASPVQTAPATPPVPTAVVPKVLGSPEMKVLEPAAKARWTIGRLECLRLELANTDECGFTADLVSADGKRHSLAKLNPLELRGKVTQSAAQKSTVIPVMVPATGTAGLQKLSVALITADGSSLAPAEIAIELAQPVARQLSRFEEEECVQSGLAYAGLTLAVTVGISLFRQCMPVIREIDFSSLNVKQTSWQLAEAAGAVLWQNLFLMPTVAVLGAIAMFVGSMLWMENTRKWLGGALIGAAWGAALGLGLSLLNAAAPVAPPKFLPVSELNRFYKLGQLEERVRIGNLMQSEGVLPGSAPLSQSTSQAARLLDATASDAGRQNDSGAPASTKSAETPTMPIDPTKSLLNQIQRGTYKSLSERIKDLDSAKSSKTPEIFYPPPDSQKLSDQLVLEMFMTSSASSPAAQPETPQQTEPPISQPPTTPETHPQSLSKPASAAISEFLAKDPPPPVVSAPTWHKEPLKGSWMWAFWGAIICGLLGTAAPLLDEEK